MQNQNSNTREIDYKKILIDNTVCGRRFHLVYEQGGLLEPEAKVNCPHCGITLFQEHNHPAVTLTREENLVCAPTGVESKLLTACDFKS